LLLSQEGSGRGLRMFGLFEHLLSNLSSVQDMWYEIRPQEADWSAAGSQEADRRETQASKQLSLLSDMLSSFLNSFLCPDLLFHARVYNFIPALNAFWPALDSPVGASGYD